MRRLVFALIGLGLVAIVGIGLTQSKGGGGQPQGAGISAGQAQERLSGAPPPLAALHEQANELLGGGTGALRARLADLEGHPVVLNGWASWCGPCRYEFPFFQRVSVDMGKQVAFVGLDTGDNAKDARAFLERFPLSYPSYEDPDNKAVTALKAPRGLPFTIFFDERGDVAYVHQGGYASRERLEQDVRRYALGGLA
jgi:cytochrome c biogenesis protein CcmG/thiol:disulfide interchange protein DsbE